MKHLKFVLLPILSSMALLAIVPHFNLAAKEISMIFVEAPTLLPTYVQFPTDYDPDEHRTVFVTLHGFGHRAERFIALASPITSTGIIFAAVSAPYPLILGDGELGYDWSLQHLRVQGPADRAAKLTVDYITTVLAGLRERYQSDRVFLMGFSQGGAFAYMSAVANHTSLDGLVIFGAGFDESWFPDGSLAEATALPVFLAHGESESEGILTASARARETLTGLGYDVTYRPFPGGHSVPLDVLAEVATWIENH